jgi:UDP-N-acetylmuramate-alanine ligase
LELIDGFKTCFKFVDKLIIPNIYESRDSENDKSKINSKKLVEIIEHSNKLD